MRHYNQGWNHGFAWGIQYWTIWEEPENPSLWSGTQDEFHRLYALAVRRLKERFPEIKTGPCIGCHLPEPWTSNFLAFCRDEKVPLDFFGWSCYKGAPEEVIGWPGQIEKKLAGYGFPDTELHMAEWNYTNPEFGFSGRQADEDPAGCYGYDAAAFATTVLTGWQDSPVAMANYYTASSVMGLLDKYAVPKKNYYGFLAFAEFARYSRRVKAVSNLAGVKILAGENAEGMGAALVSAFKSPERALNLAVAGARTDRPTVRRIDRDANLEPVAFRCEANTVVLDKEPGSAVFLVEGFRRG